MKKTNTFLTKAVMALSIIFLYQISAKADEHIKILKSSRGTDNSLVYIYGHNGLAEALYNAAESAGIDVYFGRKAHIGILNILHQEDNPENQPYYELEFSFANSNELVRSLKSLNGHDPLDGEYLGRGVYEATGIAATSLKDLLGKANFRTSTGELGVNQIISCEETEEKCTFVLMIAREAISDPSDVIWVPGAK